MKGDLLVIKVDLLYFKGYMERNKILKNATWIIGCKIIQALLTLIVTMITARYLGPSNYGIINYAASLVAFAIPITQLGFRNTLVQELVLNPENEGKILGSALGLSLISAFTCMTSIVLFASVVNKGETETIIVCGLYSISLIFQALEMIQYWFQYKLVSKYTAIISLIAYIIISIYKITILISGESIYWFAISQALDYMIIAIGLLIVYYKMKNYSLSFSLKEGKRMFLVSKYYIVSNLMVTVFANTDSVMLKFIAGETELGYYSAAIVCANMTNFVFAAIIDSARPVIFQSKKNNQKSFENNMIRLYSIIICLSLIQSCAIAVFSDLIVSILYGKEYIIASDILRVVVWYITFSCLGTVRNIWMLAEGKQKYLWIINMSGAIFNVILNMILIPIMGAMGAAIASLLTQIFTNVIVGFIIKPIRYNNKIMLKALNIKWIFEMIIRH